ncbi:hypothetical protein [Caminibacter pacificus]
MILSLLGLSVYPDSKSLYTNNTDLEIKKGEYINSIDALINSFKNEKFILLGTKKAVEKHKEVFNFGDNVEFIEFDDKNLNDIFIKIMNVLINNSSENIVFDITHSFRDAVLMSVISTIISQIIYNPNITMIYAKEIERFKEYSYEKVGEDILNTSNIAMILATFLNTLKIPNLQSKYGFYDILNDFSVHLLSNQFKDIFDKDIDIIKDYISQNRKNLFFIKPLLDELEEFVNSIEELKSKKSYEKFLFFSELFWEKDYFLHSSTYLIESISLYLLDALKEQGYFETDDEEYETTQKIVALLKYVHNDRDFNFPNEYFVYVNYKIINKFADLREKVADIRHNLAHINTNKTFGEIKVELKKLIEEYKKLIDNKLAYKFQSGTLKYMYTTKYKLKQHHEKLSEFKTSGTMPKLSTLLNKYKNNDLSSFTNLDIKKVKKYLDRNIKDIEKLYELEKNRTFIVDEIGNNSIKFKI